jgi:hypothetical protein
MNKESIIRGTNDFWSRLGLKPRTEEPQGDVVLSEVVEDGAL